MAMPFDVDGVQILDKQFGKPNEDGSIDRMSTLHPTCGCIAVLDFMDRIPVRWHEVFPEPNLESVVPESRIRFDISALPLRCAEVVAEMKTCVFCVCTLDIATMAAGALLHVDLNDAAIAYVPRLAEALRYLLVTSMWLSETFKNKYHSDHAVHSSLIGTVPSADLLLPSNGGKLATIENRMRPVGATGELLATMSDVFTIHGQIHAKKEWHLLTFQPHSRFPMFPAMIRGPEYKRHQVFSGLSLEQYEECRLICYDHNRGRRPTLRPSTK